jgi:hypothetical protein
MLQKRREELRQISRERLGELGALQEERKADPVPGGNKIKMLRDKQVAIVEAGRREVQMLEKELAEAKRELDYNIRALAGMNEQLGNMGLD